MKALKIIGIVLGVIVLIILGIILTLNGEGHLERSITINAPAAKVFKVVNSYSYNNEWSPWYKIDPETKYVYSETTSGVGSKYSWESDNPDVGSGEQEIIGVIENELVITTMKFGGMTGDYHASFILEKIDNKTTKVTWTYDGTADAVMEKFFIDYLVNPMLGPMYEQGVEDLKTYIEGLHDYTIEIENVSSDGIPYIGIRVPMPANAEEIGPKMGQLYAQIGAFMAKNNIAMAGMPMTIYYFNEDGSIDMECAMPTAESIETADDEIVSKITFAGRLIKGIHLGDYSKLEDSHTQLLSYLENNNLKQAGEMYEIYITDPGAEPDTSKWQTDIFIPISN